MIAEESSLIKSPHLTILYYTVSPHLPARTHLEGHFFYFLFVFFLKKISALADGLGIIN